MHADLENVRTAPYGFGLQAKGSQREVLAGLSEGEQLFAQVTR